MLARRETSRLVQTIDLKIQTTERKPDEIVSRGISAALQQVAAPARLAIDLQAGFRGIPCRDWCQSYNLSQRHDRMADSALAAKAYSGHAGTRPKNA